VDQGKVSKSGRATAARCPARLKVFRFLVVFAPDGVAASNCLDVVTTASILLADRAACCSCDTENTGAFSTHRKD